MTKILVIEDDEHIKLGITDILELYDYEVASASNGVEGIAVAREYDPHLILCDVMMPQLDGYGVLQAVRKIPNLSRVPFIFLTARATRENMREGMALGADDYLTKPFSGDELVSAIQIRLERYAETQKYDLQQMDFARQYINLTLPHELRTPLSTMMGYIYVLEEGLDDMDKDMIRDMLGAIKKATGRLGNLIENYVAYGQVQLLRTDTELVEKIRREYSTFHDFDGLVAQIAEKAAHDAGRAKDLEIHVERVSAHISFDHAKKALTEIFGNAFKFSSKGSPVTIIAKLEDDRYMVSVSNEGRGLTADQIANIKVNHQFEREKYEQQGAGLGLVLSRTILELYDGQLTVESEPDVLTTVRMVFQLA